MNTAGAAFLLLILAAVLANLPFITQQFFVFFKKPEKTIAWRLLELIVFYGLFVLLGFGLESYMGRTHSQGWQFYAITFLMFLVLAYPGYVWRYLKRQKG